MIAVHSTSQRSVHPAVDSALHAEGVVHFQKAPIQASLPSSGSGCLGKDSLPFPLPGSQVRDCLSLLDSEVNANSHAESQTVTSPQSAPASPVCASSPGARSGERGQEELASIPEKR